LKVLVPEENHAEARKIINEWESIQPASEDPEPEARTPGGTMIFITGVIVGAGIMYWLLNA